MIDMIDLSDFEGSYLELGSRDLLGTFCLLLATELYSEWLPASDIFLPNRVDVFFGDFFLTFLSEPIEDPLSALTDSFFLAGDFFLGEGLSEKVTLALSLREEVETALGRGFLGLTDFLALSV